MPGNGHVVWHPERFRSSLDAELYRRADLVGRVAVDGTRQLLSTPGSPGDYSRPGQPPRRQSGRLQKSITSTVVATRTHIYSAIGTPLFYGRILEKNLNRRFLSRALRDYRDTFRRVLIRGG